MPFVMLSSWVPISDVVVWAYGKPALWYFMLLEWFMWLGPLHLLTYVAFPHDFIDVLYILPINGRSRSQSGFLNSLVRFMQLCEYSHVHAWRDNQSITFQYQTVFDQHLIATWPVWSLVGNIDVPTIHLWWLSSMRMIIKTSTLSKWVYTWWQQSS